MTLKEQGRRPTRGAAAILSCALLLGGCFGTRADQYLQSGKAKLAANDLRGAAIELKNALQKDASLAEARCLLGAALLRQGDLPGALAELERGERLGCDANQVVPLLARALGQLGRHDALLTRFSSTVLSQPAAMAELQVALARAHLAAGRPAQAASVLQLALAAAPHQLDAQQLQASVMATEGDLPGAIARVRELATQQPKVESNWLLLGDLQLAVGQPDAARQSYNAAIQLNPAGTQGYASLLPVLLAAADWPAATAALAALEKTDAHSPLARYYKAWVQLEQGELAAAQALAESLLKQSPNNPELLYLAGAIEARKGSPDRAVDLLGKAVAGAPQQLRPRLLLAQSQLQRGDADMSLQTLQPLLKLASPPAEALVLAASAAGRTGDVARAQQLLTQSVAQDPQNVQGRVGLAMARVDKGEVDEGVRMLRDVARSTPDLAPDVALVETLARHRRLDAALEAIGRLETKPGGKVTADLLRGQLELARNNVAQARQAFDAVLIADPRNLPAAAALANLDVADRHPEAAQARLQKLLERDPANAVARSALLRLASERGVPNDELVSMARQAVKQAPNSRELRLGLVRLLLAKPDAKQAAQAAQEGVNLLGDDPQLLGALAQAQLASGDANLAMKSFSRLLTLKPDAALVHLGLAEACRQAGDNARAQQVLKHGIELLPDEPALYRAQAALAMAADQPAQALRVAAQLQARPKAGAEGWMLEGDLLGQQQRWDDAIRAYTAGLAKPSGSLLAVRLYQAQLKAGKADAAAAFERRWLADQPKDVQFIAMLGESALQARRNDQAETRFRQALALEPRNPALLNNLAWVVSQQGKPAAALELAQRAVEIAPRQPDFWDTLAEIRAATMQYDGAIQAQQQALTLAPGNAVHRLHLARHLLQAGKKADAKTELGRLAQLGNRFELRAEVQRMLATL